MSHMPVARISLSVSNELAGALREVAAERGEELSRLIETLLRENPIVADAVQRHRRLRAVPALKKGRSLEELLLLGKIAQAQWKTELASGRIKVPGWEP